MAFERIFISLLTFCEELGIDPDRFLCVENAVDVPPGTWGRGKGRGIVVVLEPRMQSSGTMPQLSDNTSRKKPRKSGKGKK